MTTRRSTSALPGVKPSTDPETLPRFRTDESAPLPSFELDDESGPRGRAANDSLPEPITEEPFDAAPTRLRSTPAPPRIDAAAFFEVAPTKVRSRPAHDVALDDVLEELRVATGHAPGAPELSTSELRDADESLEIEVDESELYELRRPSPKRDVWNVHASPSRSAMVTVHVERPKPKSRLPMLLTASFFGAAVASGAIALFLLRAPVAPSPAAAPARVEAPPVVAPREALPADGVATTGLLKLPPSARGQRVLLDDDVLEPKDAQSVACGVHSLRIGGRPWAEIDVPCGGELSVR